MALRIHCRATCVGRFTFRLPLAPLPLPLPAANTPDHNTILTLSLTLLLTRALTRTLTHTCAEDDQDMYRMCLSKWRDQELEGAGSDNTLLLGRPGPAGLLGQNSLPRRWVWAACDAQGSSPSSRPQVPLWSQTCEANS